MKVVQDARGVRVRASRNNYGVRFKSLDASEGAYFPGGSYDSATPTTTAPRLRVLVMSTMASGAPLPGSALYRVDGATQTLTLRSGVGTMQPFTTANFTVVGAVSATPSTGITGEVRLAEALIYDRALTTQEITAVETALTARYGIKPVTDVGVAQSGTLSHHEAGVGSCGNARAPPALRRTHRRRRRTAHAPNMSGPSRSVPTSRSFTA